MGNLGTDAIFSSLCLPLDVPRTPCMLSASLIDYLYQLHSVIDTPLMHLRTNCYMITKLSLPIK